MGPTVPPLALLGEGSGVRVTLRLALWERGRGRGPLCDTGRCKSASGSGSGGGSGGRLAALPSRVSDLRPIRTSFPDFGLAGTGNVGSPLSSTTLLQRPQGGGHVKAPFYWNVPNPCARRTGSTEPFAIPVHWSMVDGRDP